MSVLYLHLQRIDKNVVSLLAVSLDNVNWYAIPTGLDIVQMHKDIVSIKKVQSAIKACVNVDNYRRIAVKLEDKVFKLYCDDMSDLIFQDYILEELIEDFRPKKKTVQSNSNALDLPVNSKVDTTSKDIYSAFFQNQITSLEEQLKIAKQIKVQDLKDKMLISEFNDNQNATQWMGKFESECVRLGISSDQIKVEGLRLFINPNLQDWYSGNLIKLKNDDWLKWKESFLESFRSKGWSCYRKAFNFRYISGSLSMYATRKECMILEVDQNMPELYRVVQIILGFPIEVQNKIDQSKTTTFNILITRLKELEDTFSFKKTEVVDKKIFDNKDLVGKNRVPCSFCDAIGFKGNFHPLDKCKHKMKYDEMYKSRKSGKEVNVNDLVDRVDVLNEVLKGNCQSDVSSCNSEQSDLEESDSNQKN